MNTLLDELILFLRLANGFKDRMMLLDRDRALVMAASCAALHQMHDVAEFCRQLILQNNHGHMVKKWNTMAEALADADFIHFLKQIRRKLPVEVAESRLVETGYECDVKRDDYSSDSEFVAAVMGIDSDWLKDKFGRQSDK